MMSVSRRSRTGRSPIPAGGHETRAVAHDGMGYEHYVPDGRRWIASASVRRGSKLRPAMAAGVPAFLGSGDLPPPR